MWLWSALSLNPIATICHLNRRLCSSCGLPQAIRICDCPAIFYWDFSLGPCSMRYLSLSYSINSMSLPNECCCLLVHFISSYLWSTTSSTFFSLLNHTQVDQILFVWATAEFEWALTSAQMDYHKIYQVSFKANSGSQYTLFHVADGAPNALWIVRKKKNLVKVLHMQM